MASLKGVKNLKRTRHQIHIFEFTKPKNSDILKDSSNSAKRYKFIQI